MNKTEISTPVGMPHATKKGADMIYAQVKGGQKLHLAYEAGEGPDDLHLVNAGYLSNPICGRPAPDGYRMTINVSLANECKNCRRVVNARDRR